MHINSGSHRDMKENILSLEGGFADVYQPLGVGTDIRTPGLCKNVNIESFLQPLNMSFKNNFYKKTIILSFRMKTVNHEIMLFVGEISFKELKKKKNSNFQGLSL